MWKMDDGIFPAGFTGSGIRDLHSLAGRRLKTTLAVAVSWTLHGLCSMGDGIELAAVGAGTAEEVRKTMRDAIASEGVVARVIKFGRPE
jgi:hypothetical protein